jgi:hypothetical protein
VCLPASFTRWEDVRDGDLDEDSNERFRALTEDAFTSAFYLLQVRRSSRAHQHCFSLPQADFFTLLNDCFREAKAWQQLEATLVTLCAVAAPIKECADDGDAWVERHLNNLLGQILMPTSPLPAHPLVTAAVCRVIGAFAWFFKRRPEVVQAGVGYLLGAASTTAVAGSAFGKVCRHCTKMFANDAATLSGVLKGVYDQLGDASFETKAAFVEGLARLTSSLASLNNNRNQALADSSQCVKLLCAPLLSGLQDAVARKATGREEQDVLRLLVGQNLALLASVLKQQQSGFDITEVRHPSATNPTQEDPGKFKHPLLETLQGCMKKKRRS